MELEQPDVAQPEEKPRDKNENKSKRNRHRHHHTPVAQEKPEAKSLSESWAETLDRKKNGDTGAGSKETEDRKSHHEAAHPHDIREEQTIELHPVDAQKLHERVQEGRDEDADIIDKPDPVWEPWRPSVEAEKSVKDLAEPAAAQQAEVLNSTSFPQESPEPGVPPQAAEVLPPAPTLPHPELDQQSVNPNTAAAQAFRPEAFSVSSPSQNPAYRSELPKEAQDIMDRLQAGNDHHLEQSAWHNIEVDNKTGQAVEPASFEYGNAFRQEQQPEAISHKQQEEEEVATASGQLAVGNDEFQSVQPDEQEAEAMTESPHDRETELKSSPLPVLPGNSLADPVLWIIFAVIVIAIIFAVVL